MAFPFWLLTSHGHDYWLYIILLHIWQCCAAAYESHGRLVTEMISYFVLKYCLMYGPAFMVTYINDLNVILFEMYLCHIRVLIKLRNICEIGLLYQ